MTVKPSKAKPIMVHLPEIRCCTDWDSLTVHLWLCDAAGAPVAFAAIAPSVALGMAIMIAQCARRTQAGLPEPRGPLMKGET